MKEATYHSLPDAIDTWSTRGFLTDHKAATADAENQAVELSKYNEKYGRRSHGIKSAIEYYTTNGSRDINTSLLSRHQKMDDDAFDAYTNLLRMFAKAKPLPIETHSYSSVGLEWGKELQKRPIGSVISSPAIISSTMNPNILKDFMPRHRLTNTTIIHYKHPVGSRHGVFIGDDSLNKHEHEMAIAPESEWKITNIEHHEYKIPSSEITARHTIISVEPHNATSDLGPAFKKHPVGESTEFSVGDLSIEKERPHGGSSWSGKAFHHDDVWEQHVRLTQHVRDANLSHEQKTSIIEYKGNGYIPLNRHLGKTAVLKGHFEKLVMEIHHNLMGAMDAIGPTPEKIHAYSGLGISGAGSIFNKRIGSKFSSPCWTSSSIFAEIAKTFSPTMIKGNPKKSKGKLWDIPESGKNTEQHILHFEIPKGSTVGGYIAAIDTHDHSSPELSAHAVHEKEFLIKPDTVWKLKAKTKLKMDKKKYRVVYTLVPHEDSTMKESTKHFAVDLTHKDPRAWRLAANGDDVREQHQRLREKSLSAPLEQNDLDVIDRYKKLESRDLNIYLFNKSKKFRTGLFKKRPVDHFSKPDMKMEDFHNSMLRSIDKLGPTSEVIHTYSGLGPEASAHFSGHKIGSIVSSPCWTSSSIDTEEAKRFTYVSMKKNPTKKARGNEQTESHILHFEIPKGSTVGGYIAPIDSWVHHRHPEEAKFAGAVYENEKEFIIKPDTKWKIVAKNEIPIDRKHTRNVYTLHPA